MAKSISTFAVSIEQGQPVFPKFAGIYGIRNTVNGMVYVGSAALIYSRWRLHRCHLRNNKHYNVHLQRSWNKHGEESFVFEVLERCERSTEVLIAREDFWMNCYAGHLYNMSNRARPGLDKPCSEHHKQILRQKMKGNKNSFGKSIGRKLSSVQVIEIIKRYVSGEHPKSIAASYMVSTAQIYRIGQRRTRHYVELPKELEVSRKARGARRQNPRGENHPSAKLTNQQTRDILFLLSFNLRPLDISKKFGVTASRVSQIARGKHGPLG